MNGSPIGQFRSLLGPLFALASIMVFLQIKTISGLPANTSSPAVPIPATSISILSGKNSAHVPQADASDGLFTIILPDSASKNGNAGPLASNNSEWPSNAPTDPGSKNADDHTQLTNPAGDLAKMLAADSSFLSCGASGNMNWTTTANSFQVIRECSLSLPQDGWVFISANGSVARQDGEYEAQFRIGIDATTGADDTDRWVNVYNDSSDGTDESAAVSVLKPVTAGTHTFYFLGKRFSGSSTVLVYDPTLTVIFIPATNSQVMTCGASGNANWTTTANSFQVMRECSLSLPQDGWVFFSADGSVARQDGEYEAQFRIGIDETTGDGDTDRWVNIYNDSGDGTDKSVAMSVLKPVTAGAHTFYFLGNRFSGSGTALVYDPTLTVIFMPAPSSQVVNCDESGNANWTTTSGTFQVIRQCVLSVPQDGWVFISADGSVARQDGEYEAQFRIGIDETAGDGDTDRWVNIYNDSGDGTDKSVAVSVLKPVTAGTYTFYFLGRRFTGSGTVLVYDPTLTVIAPGAKVYLPLIIKGQ